MNHWAELPTLARVFYLKVSASVEEDVVYRFHQAR
jgi:hypothetical protein